jgi:rhamnosyltransferase
MLVSVIIRTLDEERHLRALLEAIEAQELEGVETEVVLVDSGSTDRTLVIAAEFGCRVERISRDEFSFGRSLNRGCAASDGEILVLISGHCVPCAPDWLDRLIAPIRSGEAGYTYGRQCGGSETRFSEEQLFDRQYPEKSNLQQEGFFCNNANAALRRDVWEKNLFDEESAGLEDMELAKRLQLQEHRIGYVAEAPVFHHHSESWNQVRWRFEREALALQGIMPEVHIGLGDFLRYFSSAVRHDLVIARQQGKLFRVATEVVCFRWQQYLGSYRGNHELRKLSKENKEHYFYPERTRVPGGGDRRGDDGE